MGHFYLHLIELFYDQIGLLKISARRIHQEIDDRLSMIKVSEMIKAEPDEMEKITLIEQICEFA